MFYRIQEYKTLFLRISLAYLFYFIARVLFYFYNSNMIVIESFREFINLCLIGLTFDTTAILYTNVFFILISLLPLKNNSNPLFQKVMMVLYFSTNAVAYSTNFFDFIYYRFSQSRITTRVFDVIENENNKATLAASFIYNYWHVLALFFICILFWIYLYKKIDFNKSKSINTFNYYIFRYYGR